MVAEYGTKKKLFHHLPRQAGRRAIPTGRYAKKIPGHHVQMDVKVFGLTSGQGKRVRRYQYGAIDDATRIRVLEICQQHSQANAIRFSDYVIWKLPFRIHTVRTHRDHEWRALFNWHVEDQGIRLVYIKPRSPQLNGKLERSHRTDQEEFCQLFAFTDDLSKKLAAWEDFCSLDRPHGADKGQTPHEALNDLIAKPGSVPIG